MLRMQNDKILELITVIEEMKEQMSGLKAKDLENKALIDELTKKVEKSTGLPADVVKKAESTRINSQNYAEMVKKAGLEPEHVARLMETQN
jgi:hypothetical protein